MAANCFKYQPSDFRGQSRFPSPKLRGFRQFGMEREAAAAVITTRAGLKGRLKYKLDGQNDTRTITVIGTRRRHRSERNYAFGRRRNR